MVNVNFPIFAKETNNISVNTRKRVHFYNAELKVTIGTKATDFQIKSQGKDFKDI